MGQRGGSTQQEGLALPRQSALLPLREASLASFPRRRSTSQGIVGVEIYLAVLVELEHLVGGAGGPESSVANSYLDFSAWVIQERFSGQEIISITKNVMVLK